MQSLCEKNNIPSYLTINKAKLFLFLANPECQNNFYLQKACMLSELNFYDSFCTIYKCLTTACTAVNPTMATEILETDKS